MIKDICLVIDSQNRIPQKEHETISIDLNVLMDELTSYSYNVVIIDYYTLINTYSEKQIKGKFFYYASSQYSIYKNYILDCLTYITQCGGILVPNINSFLAHENKVLQELEKKRLGISSPKSNIIGTLEEGMRLVPKLEYPCVVKTSTGFSSKGVSMVHNEKEAIRFVRKNMNRFDGEKLSHKFKHFLRKIKHPNLYPIKTGKILFQELIDNLSNDWKVLIYHDRIFTLKRFTKKGDFKASGSGLFDFNATPPIEVLNFAYHVRQLLDVPFASLDIAMEENIPYLIEYQSLHFGLITAMNGKVFYSLQNKEWVENKNDFAIEKNFAYAINKHINKIIHTKRI